MSSACLTLQLTPKGHLLPVAEVDAPPLSDALSDRLAAAFAQGAGHGLLHLGAAEVATALPPQWAYWRDFAARYVTALTATPEDGEIAVAAPDARALETLCLDAPPMVGVEYLTPEILRALWSDIESAVKGELAVCNQSLQDFLKSKHPAWNLVGRVHFNLAENRKDPDAPFAKAWCDNLEAYSDFENRLPRGRAYVRNGSVIDLKIEPGKVHARVMGSSLYQVEIGIAAVPEKHWKSLAKECARSIASLVELLQGKLSKAVMERICQPKTGLFPAPKDIHLNCSCPDWATMCKHVAAVLYGVGARLDEQPELLFTLRQVDASELVTRASELSATARKTPAKGKVLEDAQLADVFGIELATSEVLPETKRKPTRARAKPANPAATGTKGTPKASTSKKSVTATTRKTTAPKPRKVKTPAAVEPAATGQSANPAAGKRASRQVASDTRAQTKRKKAHI